MSDEGEYYSIHDEIRDIAVGDKKKVIELPKINEMDDIRRSLKYILDKITNMDRYIRSSQYKYGNRVLDGEAFKREVIEKFLSDLRDGVASEEEAALFKNILSQKLKSKEISDL